MSEPAHDPELASLRDALARLRPAPDPIDLGRLLFRAGQASVPRRGWAWPCATAASALLAAALGAGLLLRPAPPTVEHIVVVHDQPPPAPTPEPAAREQPVLPAVARATPEDTDRGQGAGDYFRLREQVLARGADALPAPTPWPAARGGTDLNSVLPGFQGPDDPAQGQWFRRLKNLSQPGGAS
jgi:hypothetical protein